MKDDQKKHGGLRPGAGRKHSKQGRMVNATYRMAAEQKAKAARLGGPNWIRKIIDEAKEPN